MSAWDSWICPLFPVTQSFFDQNQLSVAWRGAVSLGPAWVTHEARWSSTGAISIWLMTGDQLSGNLNAVCFGIWSSNAHTGRHSVVELCRLTRELGSESIRMQPVQEIMNFSALESQEVRSLFSVWFIERKVKRLTHQGKNQILI